MTTPAPLPAGAVEAAGAIERHCDDLGIEVPSPALARALAIAALEAARPHLVAAAMEPYGVTLATLHSLVERSLAGPPGNGHGRGYRAAMQDVQAVLDKHAAPASEPVIFGDHT